MDRTKAAGAVHMEFNEQEAKRSLEKWWKPPWTSFPIAMKKKGGGSMPGTVSVFLS